MSEEKKASPTKDLLVGSGVVILVYGIAIAAIVVFFIGDDNTDEADGLSNSGSEVATVAGMVSPAESLEADDLSNSNSGSEVATVAGMVSPAESVEADDLSSSDNETDTEAGMVSSPESVAMSSSDIIKAVVNGTSGTIDNDNEDRIVAVESTDSALTADVEGSEKSNDLIDGDKPEDVAQRGVSVKTLSQVPQQQRGVETQELNDIASEVQPASETNGQSTVLVSSFDKRPLLTLTGRVVNQFEKPVAGLQVFVYLADNSDGDDKQEQVASTTTNSGGDFQFPDLEKNAYIIKTAFGDSISVFDFARSGAVDIHIVSSEIVAEPVAAANAPTAVQVSTDINQPELSELVASEKFREYTISGTVFSDAGVPLPDVAISYAELSNVRTKIDGQYLIPLAALPDSQQALVYQLQGYQDEVRYITPALWATSNELRQNVVLRPTQ